MADRVEKNMQQMVEELDDLRRKRIFDESELKEIVKKRREFEYQLLQVPSKPEFYLGYVRYEVAVECLRAKRNRQLGWKTHSISDRSGISRMNHILDKATKKHKGNKKMWYQHIDFSLRTGSFRILSAVMLRALKWHPKEVPIWLMAADVELRANHVQAARKLLMQSLRCVPKSAKLWCEFLRLELAVGGRVWAYKSIPAGAAGAPVEETAEDQGEKRNSWAPATLVLRKAVGRLSSKPPSCAIFFTTALQCLWRTLKAVDGDSDDGLKEYAAEFRTALAAHRPGVAEGEDWKEVPEEVATTLWRLWWEFEIENDENWTAIGAAVAETAPAHVLRTFAAMLGAMATQSGKDAGSKGEAVEGLAELAGTAAASVEAETALTMLETLDHCISRAEDAEPTKAAEKAAKALLKRAAKAHPSNARLQLQARKGGGKQSLGQIAKDAKSMEVEEAVGLTFLTSAGDEAAKGPRLLETLLRGLAASTSARPLVAAHLGKALAAGGLDAFRTACDGTRAVANKIWDLPLRRAEVLILALDSELRCCSAELLVAGETANAVQVAKRLSSCFEDILSSLHDDDEEKEDWWIRYLEFVQRHSRWGTTAAQKGASGSRALPSLTDLNWRAMRSVGNQARYLERAHKLMEAVSPGVA